VLGEEKRKKGIRKVRRGLILEGSTHGLDLKRPRKKTKRVLLEIREKAFAKKQAVDR